MSDCIFCDIVAGKIPATKIYEDKDVVAFMDIGPIVKGHALVIPRRHFEFLFDVPLEILSAVMAAVQKIANAQMSGLDAEGINIHQSNGSAAGQEVPHLHFHVIPRYSSDGHSWNWHPRNYENAEEMDHLAESISREIQAQ